MTKGAVADRHVLDTSAVLTLTDNEDGADFVERLLTDARRRRTALLGCSITLMELYYVALRARGDDEAARLIGLVKAWPLGWVWPNEKILLQAGRLKASYSLAVADAMIAAVAIQHQACLVHKDPEFLALEGELTLHTRPLKAKRRK